MEARQVLEQLGDPINAYISSHEVLEVDNKSVSVRLYLSKCQLHGSRRAWQRSMMICYAHITRRKMEQLVL